MENKNVFFEISNTLPEVSISSKCHIRPPYVHFRRQCNEYILYYILEGEMLINEDDVEYTLREHEYIILDPSREHVGRDTSTCQFMYIHFKGTLTENDSPCCCNSVVVPKYGKIHTHECHVAILKYQEQLEERLKGGHVLCKASANLNLYSILIEIANDFRWRKQIQDIEIKGKIRDVIPQLVKYLDTSYNEDITGSSLEEKYHFHFDYMNRQFTKWTGSTIFNYLTKKRIDQARQLLSTGFYSPKEVAAMTGYKDVSYFSKVFKKETGTTPGKWA